LSTVLDRPAGPNLVRLFAADQWLALSSAGTALTAGAGFALNCVDY